MKAKPVPAALLPLHNLLSVKEAAQVLGIAVKTLRTWIADGKIPYIKLAGSTIRIQHEALHAFVAAHATRRAGKATG